MIKQTTQGKTVSSEFIGKIKEPMECILMIQNWHHLTLYQSVVSPTKSDLSSSLKDSKTIFVRAVE